MPLWCSPVKHARFSTLRRGFKSRRGHMIVFVAGSRKFFRDIENFIALCRKNGIKASNAGKPSGPDTFESEKAALLRAFRRIDKSDAVYVIANGGYIGKTVALEIAYAFAKKKLVVSSETIEDFSARSLVSKVMAAGKFIEHAVS
jgi:hypothetical protein